MSTYRSIGGSNNKGQSSKDGILMHNNNSCPELYYKFHDERVKVPMKFTGCDCEVIEVTNGDCLVKACKTHIESTPDRKLKYISPFIEPAYPFNPYDLFLEKEIQNLMELKSMHDDSCICENCSDLIIKISQYKAEYDKIMNS